MKQASLVFEPRIRGPKEEQAQAFLRVHHCPAACPMLSFLRSQHITQGMRILRLFWNQTHHVMCLLQAPFDFLSSLPWSLRSCPPRASPTTSPENKGTLKPRERDSDSVIQLVSITLALKVPHRNFPTDKLTQNTFGRIPDLL